MSLSADAQAALDVMPDPIVVVDADGLVVHLNEAARTQCGAIPKGRPLSDVHRGDRAAFDTYIHRCLGTRQAMAGGLILERDGKLLRFKCQATLFLADARRLVLLRLKNAEEGRFAALSRKIAERDMEIRERRSIQAKLEEALRARELLLRELQHRVKNNMHMLSGLLITAEREATSREAQAALRHAAQRFGAVSAVQQLFYTSANLSTINATDFVAAIVRANLGIAATESDVDVTSDSVELPVDTAVPLALILNELFTNALKYGFPASGKSRLRVSLTDRNEEIELVVEDNGPGFSLGESRKRASGIGLVKGLVRQLGGRFTVERTGGARCLVSIPRPRRIRGQVVG